MDYQSHWLYKEICSMSKEFRASIRHMPIEHRADIGKEIRSTLRKAKYQTYKAIKTNELLNPDDKKGLIDTLNIVKIQIDECLEDNILSIKGDFNVVLPRKRLKEILEQLGTTEDVQQ